MALGRSLLWCFIERGPGCVMACMISLCDGVSGETISRTRVTISLTHRQEIRKPFHRIQKKILAGDDDGANIKVRCVQD